MSKFTVCARFRPLSAREQRDHGTVVCVQRIDAENFDLKDEKDGNFTFSFDKVFYEGSVQSDVFDFLGLPILNDTFNGINGAIITYGQTGAGKTYTVEGPGVLCCDEDTKGLLTRVVESLVARTKSPSGETAFSIKLSMVEIYMEKIRDLIDMSKDNLQIMESKTQGVFLNGVTEVPLLDAAEALECISRGIANRAVEETQMNMASSRSHCIYIFTMQQEYPVNKWIKNRKLVLVDLAGSEKMDKTGAEGRILEEAKMINKSLSALGNVVNALTSSTRGKANHIPYRDSKLTRLLQDALGGNSRTALLCCCSPSPTNASETLSTLRFGARANHIIATPSVKLNEDRNNNRQSELQNVDKYVLRVLNKLRATLDAEAVDLIEEIFFSEGLLFCPDSIEELDLEAKDTTAASSSLQPAADGVSIPVAELEENEKLKSSLKSSQAYKVAYEKTRFVFKLCALFSLLTALFIPFSLISAFKVGQLTHCLK